MPSPQTMRLLRDHFRTAPVSEQREILKGVKASFENKQQESLTALNDFLSDTKVSPATLEDLRTNEYDMQEGENVEKL